MEENIAALCLADLPYSATDRPFFARAQSSGFAIGVPQQMVRIQFTSH
jgi:hypothetical protein